MYKTLTVLASVLALTVILALLCRQPRWDNGYAGIG